MKCFDYGEEIEPGAEYPFTVNGETRTFGCVLCALRYQKRMEIRDIENGYSKLQEKKTELAEIEHQIVKLREMTRK